MNTTHPTRKAALAAMPQASFASDVETRKRPEQPRKIDQPTNSNRFRTLASHPKSRFVVESTGLTSR